MAVWITFVGLSPMAVVNTLWMARQHDHISISKLYLLTNQKIANDSINAISSECRAMFPGCEVKEVQFSQENVDDIISVIKAIIARESAKNTLIDITAGRKFMSAVAMKAGVETKVEKIYYLYLKDDKYLNKRYDEIPVTQMELYNLREHYD